MNKLEEIAQNSNYDTYLQRMTNSFQSSSKKFLPLLCKGGKVLDVGCGSGVLLKEFTQMGFDVKGIDLNQNAIDVCKKENLNAEKIDLSDIKEKYDSIIFSSVLHEISSYDETNKFTTSPIIAALFAARNILNDNGQILIRDGLCGSSQKIKLIAKNESIVEDFKQYIKDAPMFNEKVLFNTHIFISGLKIYAPEDILKEFLYTYTWGKESYSREVQERYGILTEKNWIQLCNMLNLKINNIITSEDDYIKYVSRFFEPNKDLIQTFEKSTIIINAQKI